MPNLSKTELQKIYSREIDYLFDGVGNISNPYHFFYLSTIKDNFPYTRTIVLRNVKNNPLKIYFNTDIRSPKIDHLKLNPNCSVLFYDNERKLQLRLSCIAYINHKNKFAKGIWKKTQLQSRKCYMGEFSPSLEVDKYEPNIPKKYLKCDPRKEDSEKGFENFSSIELIINYLDILELHHDGHIRFRVDSNNKFSFITI